MAYQIEYDMKSIRVIKRNLKKEVMSGLILTAVLVIGAICGHLGGALLEMLLSQRDTAHSAAEQLIEDIRTGEELQDAVASFCAELMQ